MSKSSSKRSPLTIALAQGDFMMADIPGNTDKIIQTAIKARDELKADIVVFPELAITGYPPEDLLLRPELLRRTQTAIEEIKQKVRNIYCVIGHPQLVNYKLYNAASVIHNENILKSYYKQRLPNYSVFDEKRYFTPGDSPCIIEIKGNKIGIAICEDQWTPGALEQNEQAGAEIILSLNASPYHINKASQREAMIRERQKAEGSLPIFYVNCVGGQDELIFDGDSFVMDNKGDIKYRAKRYEEQLDAVTIDLTKDQAIERSFIAEDLTEEESIYQALLLGTRDYTHKNTFKGAIIGLSGGIDSALTLAIAVDALGAKNVHAVLMPSRYTSDISSKDAKKLCKNLNVSYSEIDIEPAFKSFLTMLAPEFKDVQQDVTEENIQARCRGILLMALSNKFGKLVLTTGNKSEMAVGYATLYGDMAGGFAVLKDIQKTLVFRLANYRNTISDVIPQRIIDRPPSAELAENQCDQDSLPPYELLDPIMTMYVEENLSIEKMIEQGYDSEIVRRVVKMIDRNEYKRRQAPPGIRISHRAFGRDWRYPITSAYQK